jgi:hypothetical protein
MEQESQPKRKLTWDEMHKAMKRVHRKSVYDSWLMGPVLRKRTSVCQKKRLARKKLKQQEEHPEEILVKKRFWIMYK